MQKLALTDDTAACMASLLDRDLVLTAQSMCGKLQGSLLEVEPASAQLYGVRLLVRSQFAS